MEGRWLDSSKPDHIDFKQSDMDSKTFLGSFRKVCNAFAPVSVQQKPASDYKAVFQLFLKYKDEIDRITFWGANDAQSWLNRWPVPVRTNYSLLFDRNFKPKPAFYSVMGLKK